MTLNMTINTDSYVEIAVGDIYFDVTFNDKSVGELIARAVVLKSGIYATLIFLSLNNIQFASI